MAWCLQAPSHYLNQCWHNISRVLWNSCKTNFTGTGRAQDINCGWGLGAFLRWWPPSTMWAGPLIYYGHHRGCLNNPNFSNLGLCAACWACFMCHHELWPPSVSHPFFSLNSSFGFAAGKHYQKIPIPIFRPVLQNFCYSRLRFLYSFLSLSFLLTFFWLVCYCSMWLYMSPGN